MVELPSLTLEGYNVNERGFTTNGAQGTLNRKVGDFYVYTRMWIFYLK